MVPNHNSKPFHGENISSSVINSAISEVEKENILSKKNDPNAFDGRGSLGVSVGMTNGELDNNERT